MPSAPAVSHRNLHQHWQEQLELFVRKGLRAQAAANQAIAASYAAGPQSPA